MDKRDHDAILNAYNLARTAGKNLTRVRLKCVAAGIVNVIKAQAQVKDVPAYLFGQSIESSAALPSWNAAPRRKRLPRRSSTQRLTWAGKTAFIVTSWPGN
jgi:hypothetical protein